MKHIQGCDLFASAQACAGVLGLLPNDQFTELVDLVPGEEYLHEVGHFLFLVPASITESITDLEKMRLTSKKGGRPDLVSHPSFDFQYKGYSYHTDGSKGSKAYSMSEAYAAAFTVAVNRVHKTGSVRVATVPGEDIVTGQGYANSLAEHNLNIQYEAWRRLVDKLARSRRMQERLKFFAGHVKS